MGFSEPSAGAGHNFADKEASWGNFVVTKSNPGAGNVVRFTVADPVGLLTTTRWLRSVIGDAIDQWIAAERADLNANGDSAVTGSDPRYIGDGFPGFVWDKAGKYAEITLSAKTNISVTGDITVSKPYADVV